MQKRAKGQSLIGGLISVEGAHALEDDLANLEHFFQAGVRIMSPTFFFDNNFAGSAQGVNKGGLTELGFELIQRMEKLGMTLDLSHASPNAIRDALSVSTRPVIVSHTGVRATCDNSRNLTDEQLSAIAATGGVIGIGFWSMMLCGNDVGSIVRAIRHTVNVVGIDHVALGSDFDAQILAPFDVSGLPLITEALLESGITEGDVGKIMGGNVASLLEKTLPR